MPDLRPSERWLLHCIKQTSTATIDQLCIDSGFCRSTAFATIKKLEGLGVLVVQRTEGQPNSYEVRGEHATTATDSRR